jgi:homoserine dehydrogenase
MTKTIGISLLGLGNVGTGLLDLLQRKQDALGQRTGIRIEPRYALIRDPGKRRRSFDIELTRNIDQILDDPGTDIVVEVMGGDQPAAEYAFQTLRVHKHFVTANKHLIAENGVELLRAGAELNRQIGFDASVGAGIPLTRTISNGLVANRIARITGILNGTTNYILTRMREDKVCQEEALDQARLAGFAEPDASFDLNGSDVAQKLAILSLLGFQTQVDWKTISRQGIESIDSFDVGAAHQFGFVIRPLGVISSTKGGVEYRVHPSFVPKDHPLATVDDEYNAIMLEGDAVGSQMLYGRGAGAYPTASALLADIIHIATHPDPLQITGFQKSQANHEEWAAQFYLRIPVPDQPGAIGKVAGSLGYHGVSISHAVAALQSNGSPSGQVCILTHETRQARIRNALSEIRSWPELRGTPVSIPILQSSTDTTCPKEFVPLGIADEYPDQLPIRALVDVGDAC